MEESIRCICVDTFLSCKISPVCRAGLTGITVYLITIFLLHLIEIRGLLNDDGRKQTTIVHAEFMQYCSDDDPSLRCLSFFTRITLIYKQQLDYVAKLCDVR